jgi:hypothetical protein
MRDTGGAAIAKSRRLSCCALVHFASFRYGAQCRRHHAAGNEKTSLLYSFCLQSATVKSQSTEQGVAEHIRMA